jgi:ABC-type transport system substrate-binding protein
MDDTWASDLGVQYNAAGNPTGEPYKNWFAFQSVGAFKHTIIDDEYYQEQWYKVIKSVDKDKNMQIWHDLQHYLYDNFLVMPLSEYSEPVVYLSDSFDSARIDKYVLSRSMIYLNELSIRS